MIGLRILGKNGKMGKEVCRLIQDKNLPFTILSPEEANKTDVVLDFSAPQVVLDEIKNYKNFSPQPAWIIGSTGWSSEQKQKLNEWTKSALVLVAPNFSIGMALMQSSLKHLQEGLMSWARETPIQITLDETHHTEKKDRPSGSALALLSTLAPLKTCPNIQITENSYREGKVIGDHSVLFQTESEELLISHRALSRTVFAQGALHAASWIYTFRDENPTRVGLFSFENTLLRAPRSV